MPTPEQFGIVKPKGILFGDDNWGTVLDEESVYKNKKGILMKKYLIVPGEHLMKQYPELQKPGALEYDGIATWREYPTYWVDDRNPSRTNAIARIDCGFDGRETTQTQRYRHFTDEIKTLREERENLAISNMYLTEENSTLLADKMSIIKENAEMVRLVKGEKSEGSGEEYPSEQ